MANPTASFALAKAIRDIDRFKPLSEREEQELVYAIHAWLNRTRIQRGDVVEFAKKGEPPNRPWDEWLELD